ncbi:MAG: ATP-binding protein [Syntrophorhabdaceae bacterium]|nr:ATP-binding protein [Syntrophorhabdaceae bacterium]
MVKELNPVLLWDIVNKTDDIIFVTDRDGKIIYANESFEKKTGYKDVLGKNPRILKSGLMSNDYYKNVYETVFSGKVFKAMVINRKKNGEIFYYDQTITPVKDEKGNITHFISTGRDVTEVKMMEEKLHQAQKFEAIGRFSSSVAHEFNNYLNVIGNYIQLALRTMHDGPPALTYLEKSLKVLEKAVQQTRSLLSFKRKSDCEWKTFEVNRFIMELEDVLFKPLSKDGIAVELNLCKESIFVKSVPSDFEKVILNLVMNAKEAMPSGGKIIIHTKDMVIKDKGALALISISDTGEGMTPEVKERIFDPFFTTKKNGSGLGLFTVYGIVRQLNGDIEVESELKKGTIFRLYLPRTEETNH